ncbi:unnamed protein product [Ascophyllum nodosum]
MGFSVKSLWTFKAFWLSVCLRAVAIEVEVTREIPDYAAFFGELTVDFDSHELGCPDRAGPIDSYMWRGVGYGSNINNMILPWLNAFGSGRRDLALVYGDYLELVKCREERNGVMTGGFSCLFEPMPHLCIFHKQGDWISFMIERNVSTFEREYALNHTHVKQDEEMVGAIDDYLQGSGIDILAAKAAVLDYFHSHWQPWVKRDIQAILDGPTIAPVRDGPYVGIHVRRSDKINAGGQKHEVQEYLEKARSYIQNSTEATVKVDDIRGIWVSSDDSQVIFDAKESFAQYFPNVERERVVCASSREFGTTNGSSSNPTPTRDYDMHVVLFAELRMLAEANVFVGTYSSNLGRMVALLRESRDMPRSSSLSLDRNGWFPTRHLLSTG